MKYDKSEKHVNNISPKGPGAKQDSFISFDSEQFVWLGWGSNFSFVLNFSSFRISTHFQTDIFFFLFLIRF